MWLTGADVALKRLPGINGADWPASEDGDNEGETCDNDDDGRSTCGGWTLSLGTGGRQADDEAIGDAEDPATEGLTGTC